MNNRNIYIEVDENFRVTKIHRMPFDPNNGMGYTREELEMKGFFVDEIPNPVNQVGRRSIAMYNPDTKSVYYECVGIPMSDKERIDYLENALDAVLNIVMGQSVMTLSSDTDSYLKEIERDQNNYGEYLAYQIISGKMTIEECLRKYPQCTGIIKKVLSDNGIQV